MDASDKLTIARLAELYTYTETNLGESYYNAVTLTIYVLVWKSVYEGIWIYHIALQLPRAKDEQKHSCVEKFTYTYLKSN